MKPIRVCVAAWVLCSCGASAEFLYMRGDKPGTFIDISATGTVLSIDADETVVITTTKGNRLLPAGRLVVGYNGAVGYGATPSDFLTDVNAPIDTVLNTPNPGVFGGGRATLMAHDNPGTRAAVTQIIYEELTDRVVIMYNDIPIGDTTISYQLQIFDPPIGLDPPREECFAQYLFADIERPPAFGGAIFTIGYQDGVGGTNNNVQWSFNTQFAVRNGSILTLCTPAPGSLAGLVLGAAAVLRRRRCS